MTDTDRTEFGQVVAADTEPTAEAAQWRAYFVSKLLPQLAGDSGIDGQLSALSPKKVDAEYTPTGSPTAKYRRYLAYRQLVDKVLPALAEHGDPSHRSEFIRALARANLVEAGGEWVDTFQEWVDTLSVDEDDAGARAAWVARKSDWLLVVHTADDSLFGDSFDQWHQFAIKGAQG